MASMRGRTAALILVATILGGCGLLGGPSPSPSASARASGGAPAASQTARPSGSGPGAGVSLATAVHDIAQRVRPAVVQVTNEQVNVDLSGVAQNIPAGVGSGIIFDQQGHILTNDHVIEGAQKLLATLPDGRVFDAKVIGHDARTDLAVLQISGNDLPVATLGDSSTAEPGDWVIAIGNALALPGGPTVTAGVVSAVHRTVQEPSDPNTGAAGPFLFDLIQTDAAINPGNSGGPLVDLSGDVIGINTLVQTQAEPGVPAQGIGFAIAISAAKPIAEELISKGHATHAFLGIYYGYLTPALAAQVGIASSVKGVLVSRVVSGSPADKAGLRARDVITAIDGQALTDESSLARIVDSHKPGDTVSLSVRRGSETLTLKATLADTPSP
ncbi:MAG: trypsin-like peptidase domain-containing protein [Chloroflexota bacterium]|nr:trypsin-like peptidase domain-containing protein [Chloroflexota bacterium]MDE3101841.1 trypsin-like peptidase domain-containing protein [Chloroflexota bacterium]